MTSSATPNNYRQIRTVYTPGLVSRMIRPRVVQEAETSLSLASTSNKFFYWSFVSDFSIDLLIFFSEMLILTQLRREKRPKVHTLMLKGFTSLMNTFLYQKITFCTVFLMFFCRKFRDNFCFFLFSCLFTALHTLDSFGASLPECVVHPKAVHEYMGDGTCQSL